MDSDESREYLRAGDIESKIDGATRELSTDAQSAEEALQNPKKRRAESTSERKAKRAKYKAVLNNYTQLLNTDVNDYLQGRVLDGEQTFKRSQIGSSEWTSSEKRLFFGALERLGKDNVAGIANIIGTKTELEVQVYVQLLQQGVIDLHRNHPRQDLSSFDEMAAALQVSPVCEKALEEIADQVALRQQKLEVSREIKKRGETWLLTQDLSKEFEEALLDNDQVKLGELAPAVTLLKLPNWLELSEKIFMNSGDPNEGNNWKSITESQELPSIYATAFEDFHSLTISVLKRLVSTSIHCAMSRLRASSPVEAQVRRQDVEVAINVLNLQHNSKSFWAGCARRNHLKVYETLKKANIEGEEPLSYEEVDRLGGQNDKETRSRANTVDVEPMADEQLSSDEDDELALARPKKPNVHDIIDADTVDDSTAILVQDLANENIDATDYVSELEDGEPNTQGLSIRDQEKISSLRQLERLRNEYIGAFDAQASMIEERRLWEMLDLGPPLSLKAEDIVLPKRPQHHRKSGDELEDWRDVTTYWSPWEIISTPIESTGLLQRTPETEEQIDMRLEMDHAEINAEEDLDNMFSSEPENDNTNIEEPYDLALLEAGAVSDQEEYSRMIPPDPPMRTKSTARYRTRSRSRSIMSDSTAFSDDDAASMGSVSTTGSTLTEEQKEERRSKREKREKKERLREEKRQRKVEQRRARRRAQSLESERSNHSNRYLKGHLVCPVEHCKYHAKSISTLTGWQSHMKARHPDRDIIADEATIRAAADMFIASPLGSPIQEIKRSESTERSRSRSASRSAFRCKAEECDQYGMGMSEYQYKEHIRNYHADDQEDEHDFEAQNSAEDVYMDDLEETPGPRDVSIEL